MSTDKVWNDKARENLRATLRWVTLGECRLRHHDHDEILAICREVYIPMECPEGEWDAFAQFADDELDRSEARLAAEMATWPEETDCDRLDRVQDELRERGIMLWQASPCCDNCTGAELGDRIEWVDDDYPGFLRDVRGYTFFVAGGAEAFGAYFKYLATGITWCSRVSGSSLPSSECVLS